MRPPACKRIRANIHVSLLAKAYSAFVGANPAPGTVRRLNPSSYERQPDCCEEVAYHAGYIDGEHLSFLAKHLGDGECVIPENAVAHIANEPP